MFTRTRRPVDQRVYTGGSLVAHGIYVCFPSQPCRYDALVRNLMFSVHLTTHDGVANGRANVFCTPPAFGNPIPDVPRLKPDRPRYLDIGTPRPSIRTYHANAVAPESEQHPVVTFAINLGVRNTSHRGLAYLAPRMRPSPG